MARKFTDKGRKICYHGRKVHEAWIMIHFEKITEDNFKAIVEMKRPDGERFVASNAYSLAQAWLYRESGDVYPFAIYSEDEPVGFMMLDEERGHLPGQSVFLFKTWVFPSRKGCL